MRSVSAFFYSITCWSSTYQSLNLELSLYTFSIKSGFGQKSVKDTGSRRTFEFPSRVNLSGHWVNKTGTKLGYA